MKQLHLPASSIDEIFTATSHNQSNLAHLHQSQRRYSEAEPLYGRSLTILMNVLGENHPHTQAGWRNFCYLVQQAVDTGRAAELSDNPITQAVLRKLQMEIGNA